MTNIELIDSLMRDVDSFTATGVQNMAAIIKIYNGLATLRENLKVDESYLKENNDEE